MATTMIFLHIKFMAQLIPSFLILVLTLLVARTVDCPLLYVNVLYYTVCGHTLWVSALLNINLVTQNDGMESVMDQKLLFSLKYSLLLVF